MANLVIVAIPREDDPVWKVSSEKVPHMTILFLGPSQSEAQIALFVEHAAKLMLTRFGLDVDRRGTLGPDNADVLFFQDNWELPKLKQFRGLLLQEPNIRKAYDSVTQYGAPQEWTPHLTLGYPVTPAKPNEHSLYWVQFDRIAVWSGDYSGPEFILEQENYSMEVMMSDKSATGRYFLAHHGIMGMRWGHRKEGPSPVSSKPGTTLIRGKTTVKTSGGAGHPPHPDAISAAEKKQKMQKSGMAALSNKDLQDLSTRMQLESNVARLHQETSSGGKKFVKRLLGDTAKNQATRIANEEAAKALKKKKQ